MSDLSPERFVQLIYDARLLEPRQVEAVWSEIGTRDVPVEEFIGFCLRKGLLTTLQVERLKRGEKHGYFYGKYRLLYLAGKGTFARVYRGQHVDTGDVAAVKVLRNSYSKDTEKRAQFLREAEIVKRMRHVNIVPVIDVGEEHGRPYMVMEFVEGNNLRDFLKIRKKFSPLESLQIVADVATGLDCAFGKGLAHRDLKLSNVLLTSTGRAKLVDFGLAAIAEHQQEDRAGKGMSERSIDYAGLERLTGVRKDHPQSDIYFTGCMLYHLLTGMPPLNESRERAQRLNASRFRDVTPIAQRDPSLPPVVVAIVQKAMELNVEKRYATPAELLADIQAAIRRLEQGDTDPEAAADDGAVGPRKTEREGEGHSVMIVESNIEMQDALRDLLKRRGYRVLVVGDAQRALTRFEADERPCECVIFCTTEMGKAALDAFNTFGSRPRTQQVPAILFVDEAHQDFVELAHVNDHRAVLMMPLKVRQLRVMLLKLLAPHTA